MYPRSVRYGAEHTGNVIRDERWKRDRRLGFAWNADGTTAASTAIGELLGWHLLPIDLLNLHFGRGLSTVASNIETE